jgi:List-Bact-rpt repeat protein
VSDVIAGRPAGGEGGGGPFNGGAPPPVLLAALGAALVIAVTLVALFGGFSGASNNAPVVPLSGTQVTPGPNAGRAQLAVSFAGSGDGEIQITPGDLSCSQSCDHTFRSGTRVTVIADAASGSTFEGWGDACDGTGRCSIVLDDERALSVTFDSKPAAPAATTTPHCDTPGAAEDPACADELNPPPDENLDTPPAPPAPAADCADGRDNDHDGLTDAAQDPDCANGGSEAGAGASPGATTTPAPPPPPAKPVNDCSDGRDNDGDGLTDRAQDPDCVGGHSEAG